MSKIEQLIKEKCPNGVEYKKIGEIATTSIGLATSVTKWKRNKGIQLLHNSDIKQNQIVIKKNEYVDENFAKRNSSKIHKLNDIITVHTGDVGTSAVITDQYVDSIGFTTLLTRINNINEVNPYYLCHYFNSELFKEEIKKFTISDRSNLNQKSFDKLFVPVPPIEVQEEIVRILDKFGELKTKLETELEVRKKQFEHYRKYMLNNTYTAIPMNELCLNISSGKCNVKNKNGKYVVYGSTGIITKTDIYKYNEDKILVARVGANAGFVHIATGKYDVTDNTLIINLKPNVNMRYVYYYLQNFNLNKLTKGGGQSLITAKQIKAININFPPLQEQERIVKILDKFDRLINDISEGIPAEIEARRKQYKYYRNKLLSFEELKTND